LGNRAHKFSTWYIFKEKYFQSGSILPAGDMAVKALEITVSLETGKPQLIKRWLIKTFLGRKAGKPELKQNAKNKKRKCIELKMQ
jgi:hypothetical protein